MFDFPYLYKLNYRYQASDIRPKQNTEIVSAHLRSAQMLL